MTTGPIQVAFYTDADEDGFGDDASVEYGCTIPADKVDVGGENDDLQVRYVTSIDD